MTLSRVTFFYGACVDQSTRLGWLWTLSYSKIRIE